MTSQTARPADMTDAPQALPDLRAPLFAAQEWLAGLIEGVRPEQLDHPTPCTEFDVAGLLSHLYGVADRTVAVGEGRDPVSVPAYVDALPENLAGAFRERTAAARRAWSDDASLGRTVEAPWGPAPAALVAGVYLSEHLTHGWDLAVATGQPCEADPQLAGIALGVMRRALPAEGREDFPFAEPVTPAADAGPTEQLANWTGRTRP